MLISTVMLRSFKEVAFHNVSMNYEVAIKWNKLNSYS